MAKCWAYCDPCGRWFYPDDLRPGMGTPPCPVCSTEAATLSDQPHGMATGPALA